MRQAFDDFIMVDWSAAAVPVVGTDSIWLARNLPNGKIESINYPTRHAFLDGIKPMLAEALRSKRRVLCGFDFCFGLPRGAVKKLRKAIGEAGDMPDWQWLWRYLDENVTDDEKNRNNRWQVASDMNQLLSGGFGPFWGFQGKHKPPYLQPTKDKSITGGLFDELRMTERCAPQEESKTAMFSVWQLAGAGAVGSQSLLGMAYLQRLRMYRELQNKVRIYPFENCDTAPIVFAESYYGRSSMPIDESVSPKDKAEVEAAVRFCRDLQKRDKLKDLLSYPKDKAILEDEGWTFIEPKPEGMILQKPPAKPVKPKTALPTLTPHEIYAQSFADIKRLTGISGNSLADKIRRRMIHASGDIDIGDDIVIHGNLRKALQGLKKSCYIISDCNMVAVGLIKSFLPRKLQVISAIEQATKTIPKKAVIPTRSAVAMEKIADKLADNIVIIGNAPTALERLLYGLREQGWQKPSLIIATPVGFVGAAESKQALEDSGLTDYITLRGRKGGSAMAAAACNAILQHHGEKGA